MIKTTDVFISIPKKRDTQANILINSDDVTSQVAESSWSKPLLSLGIGGFSLKLSNNGGQISDKYKKGDVVYCYLDNTDGTRLQFRGRIDYPRENLQKEGQYLEIEGRHRSYFLSERRVCYRATSKDCGQILIDIIGQFASECTYNNVEVTGVLTDVNWDYKPFHECVTELMSKSGYDAYVDDDLDIHLFEANSILNGDEAVAEGDNFLQNTESGNDDYYEKTRVTVIGKDDVGIPIVYTAINGIDDTTEGREDDGIREVFVRDLSANTMEKVKIIAQSTLSEYTNRAPQGIFDSFGIETLTPGENLWVAVPRQKIMGIYKALEITHTFGSKMGGWRTRLITEFRPQDTREIFSNVIQKNSNLSNADNFNKLNYSYNIPFDDDTLTYSSTNATISEGSLYLDDGQASGEWVSNVVVAPSNVSEIELRVVGTNLGGTTFFYSLDDGFSWTQMVDRVIQVPGQAGKNIKIKISLATYSSAAPEIKSMAVLYS